MQEAGIKSDYKKCKLYPVDFEQKYNGLATKFPTIPEGYKLLCVYAPYGCCDGTEKIYVCDTLENMNQLLQSCNDSFARKISFATISEEDFENKQKMSREDVVFLMRKSRSEEEWRHNADTIKDQFNGQSPPFWHKTIVKSGVIKEVRRSWPRKMSSTLHPVIEEVESSDQEDTDSPSVSC